MLSAATTSPPAPRTGAAIAASPVSSSSTVVANPWRRTVSSSASSCAGSVIVFGVKRRSGGAGSVARPNAEEHLAVGGAVVVDRAPEPLAGADEVAALDLRHVLDAVASGDREVDRLPASPRRARPATAAPAPPRCARACRARRRAGSPARGAGARAAHPAPSARGARARVIRREAVLFGMPLARRQLGQRDRLLALEHPHEQLGAAVDRSDSVRLRARSVVAAVAPRSFSRPFSRLGTLVPRLYSTGLGAARSSPKREEPTCSSTRCPVTRS